jgi:hypothetical protein
MILGFVHLAQTKVKEAREDFERSIELDSTDPFSFRPRICHLSGKEIWLRGANKSRLPLRWIHSDL